MSKTVFACEQYSRYGAKHKGAVYAKVNNQVPKTNFPAHSIVYPMKLWFYGQGTILVIAFAFGIKWNISMEL